MKPEIKELLDKWTSTNNMGWMTPEVKQRIKDSSKIMNKVRDEGFDAYAGLVEEALDYFLISTLSDVDFDRLKKEMKIK